MKIRVGFLGHYINLVLGEILPFLLFPDPVASSAKALNIVRLLTRQFIPSADLTIKSRATFAALNSPNYAARKKRNGGGRGAFELLGVIIGQEQIWATNYSAV